MNLTKEYLANYPYLRQVIERNEKKLQKYRDNPPEVLYGKVYGSNSCFPYERRGFSVCGPSSSNGKEWKQRVQALELELDEEKRFLAQLMVEIDELIVSIKNPRDKLVFEYLYHDGMTQDKVAKILNIDQSVVSRTVNRYVVE